MRQNSLRLIILPGLDGTGLLHGAFLNALPSDMPAQVVAYPGYMSGYDELTSWVGHRLPKNEPFVIVAESFSGPIAVALAQQALPSLKAVVFVASFAERPRRVPIWFAHGLGLFPLRNRLSVRLIQWVAMGTFRKTAFTQDLHRALSVVTKDTLTRRLAETLRKRAPLSLNLPSLYLRAKSDWLVPKRHGDQFGQKGAAVESIQGPHFLLQAQPAACAKQIADFARNLK